MLSTIEDALADFKEGKFVIVVDDEDRENEGDFITAAELITEEKVNFMLKNGRGVLCAPITITRAEELELERQVQTNTSMLVFVCTWRSSSSSSARVMVMGAQRTPRPFFSMKFTFSSVISSAAVMKSPSFSRSSSSTTITNLPSLKSAKASSMVLSMISLSIICLFVYSFNDKLS